MATAMVLFRDIRACYQYDRETKICPRGRSFSLGKLR
jgi:hypothetical protein